MSTFNITPNTFKYVGGYPNVPNTVSPYPYQYAFGINDVGYGETINTDFYNGLTPVSGGYTIYCPTLNVIHAANNDAEMISTANVLLGSNYDNLYDAIYNLLDSAYCIFNYDLPDFPTNGLVTLVQSGFSSSFDVSFENRTRWWYGMTQVGGGNFYFDFPPLMDGNAIIFDGTTTKAVITDPSNIPTGNQSYTISAWVQTSDNTIEQQVILAWGAEANNEMNSLQLFYGEPVNSYYNNDLYSGTTLDNDSWYNITATYDVDTNLRSVYINGSLYNQDYVDGPQAVPTAANCTIGALPVSGTNLFNGLIQNVAIYNTALSADDVYFYYNQWLPFFPAPIPPIGADFTIEWWQYMQSSGSFPRPYSIGSYPSAANAVSLEGGASTFYYWANSGYRGAAGVSGLINNWVNFAIVRSAGVITIYKDGNSISSFTYNGAIPTLGNPFYIGSEGTGGSFFQGLMADFRWTNSAVYTSNYTPSTTPLTALSETKLLCFQGTSLGAQLTDNSGLGNTLTGGVSFNATSPYAGYVGSTQFSGSTDISVTPVSNFNIGAS